MRLRPAALAAAFAVALIAVYFTGRAGWPVYVALVVGVSMVGGWLIARPWAVGLSLGVNIVFSALSLAFDILVVDLEHVHGRSVGEVALIYVGQVLVSAAATAAAVQLRGGFATRFAKAS